MIQSVPSQKEQHHHPNQQTKYAASHSHFSSTVEQHLSAVSVDLFQILILDGCSLTLKSELYPYDFIYTLH